ncbi:MAG: MarR family winged helix-turn-helix transcriptional regulator [Sphaerochaeta sp.]|jgi:DNA-binding MarR family transcriptional regulator|uniref:MarR family winged helix-turn-helix transcriptional regulator n=1 Tax=Sphaerochaeta sp. TaxID=1972642 RepID=UPI002FCBD949
MIDLCAIRKLQTSLRNLEDQLKKQTGLSFNDALLLCAVNKGIYEPGALAKELELSPSRLTRVLDSLEERNLIKRTLSSADRRSLTISLTEIGNSVVQTYSCSEMNIPEDLAFTQANT